MAFPRAPLAPLLSSAHTSAPSGTKKQQLGRLSCEAKQFLPVDRKKEKNGNILPHTPHSSTLFKLLDDKELGQEISAEPSGPERLQNSRYQLEKRDSHISTQQRQHHQQHQQQ